MKKHLRILALIAMLLLLFSVSAQAKVRYHESHIVFKSKLLSSLDKTQEHWLSSAETKADLAANLIVEAATVEQSLIDALNAFGAVVCLDELSVNLFLGNGVCVISYDEQSKSITVYMKGIDGKAVVPPEGLERLETTLVLDAVTKLSDGEQFTQATQADVTGMMKQVGFDSEIISPLKKTDKYWVSSAKTKATLTANLILEAEAVHQGVAAALNGEAQIYVGDKVNDNTRPFVVLIQDKTLFLMIHNTKQKTTELIAVGSSEEGFSFFDAKQAEEILTAMGIQKYEPLDKSLILEANEQLANWGK